VHDNLGFAHKNNDSVYRLAGGITPNSGAHTTISSDGLQNELVIGRVGVFGNLGKGKSIDNPESTSEGDLWAKGRATKTSDHRRQNWGIVHTE